MRCFICVVVWQQDKKINLPVIGVNLSEPRLNCCSFSFKYAFEQFWKMKQKRYSKLFNCKFVIIIVYCSVNNLSNFNCHNKIKSRYI